MSGLGRIQRAIDAEDADLYAPEDLTGLINRGPATGSRRRAVLRAAHSLVRKYPEKIALIEDKDRDLLWLIHTARHGDQGATALWSRVLQKVKIKFSSSLQCLEGAHLRGSR
jgi:hypothetical protein